MAIDFQPIQSNQSESKIDFQPISQKSQKQDILNPLIRSFGVPFGIPYNTAVPTPQQVSQDNPVAGGLNQTARDALSIPTNFFNQFALNYPRSIANTAGYQLPTESESGAGQVANKAAGVAGALISPVFKAIGGINAFNPLTSNIARGALAGGAYAPTDNVFDMKQRGIQAGAGAVLSPVAAGVGSLINKMAPSYFDANIMPRVNKMFNDSVNDWNDPIQNFANKKLNIPQNVINHISDRTPAGVEASSDLAGNTHDSVYQAIQEGFQQKNQEIGKAYEDAFDSVPEGTQIPIKNTRKAVSDLLQQHGLIDKLGNPTNIAVNEQPNTVLGNLYKGYKALVPEVGANSTQLQRANPSPINEDMWSDLRNKLTDIRNLDSRYSGKVTKILDSLHEDAESAGIPVNQARDMAREYYQNLDLQGKFNQNKLGNIFKSSGQDERDLQQVGKYLGQDLVTPSKDIAANQALQKIKGFGQSAPMKPSLLEQRLDPLQHITQIGKVKPTKSEFEELLGKSPELNNVFNDLRFKRYSGAAITGTLGLGGLAAHAAIDNAHKNTKKIIGIEDDN